MRSLGNTVRIIALASLVGTSSAQAQGGISLGYTDLGVVVGLGGLNGANIAFGGRFERIFKALPDMADGLLGLQVGVDWWSWNYAYFPGNHARVSYVPIGVTANYHFKMMDKRFDPFLGAGLGYEIVNVNASCVYQNVDYCRSYSSDLYVVIKGGIRYFMSSATALYADVGVGAATLNLGATFRMR